MKGVAIMGFMFIFGCIYTALLGLGIDIAPAVVEIGKFIMRFI